MERLAACPVEGPDKKRRGVREWWVVDRKDQGDSPKAPLTLIITSDQHDFVVYSLDRREVAWGAGHKRPDAVLVANLGTTHLVCFIEMKSTMKGDSAVYQKALAQLRSGVDHFCPAGRRGSTRVHGDEHHDRWRDGDDLIEVMPSANHVVCGVCVVLRQAPPRPLPQRDRISGKDVDFLLLSVPAEGFNRARLTLEALCYKLGVSLP